MRHDERKEKTVIEKYVAFIFILQYRTEFHPEFFKSKGRHALLVLRICFRKNNILSNHYKSTKQ